LFAVVGIASAWRGGLLWSAVGLGAAILGLIVLQSAVGFFNPPPQYQYWSADSSDGGSWIFLAFCAAAIADIASMSARSWYEMRRSKDPTTPHIAGWTVLGLVTTGLLILAGLGIVAGVILALAISR
jgi:hypothetical protein